MKILDNLSSASLKAIFGKLAETFENLKDLKNNLDLLLATKMDGVAKKMVQSFANEEWGEFDYMVTRIEKPVEQLAVRKATEFKNHANSGEFSGHQYEHSAKVQDTLTNTFGLNAFKSH